MEGCKDGERGSSHGDLEPLAIIGFSFKFPGDAATDEALWKVLQEKRSLMEEWPLDRFRMDAFTPKEAAQQLQKTVVPGAHFVKDDLSAFDAPFFGISATEAISMDPQSRILLETTYHALENAGIPMEQVKGSKTGVYSGSMAEDYRQIIFKDVDEIPKYAVTGVAVNMVANRISWFYDFQGPSIHMDSACSSSLVAFDVACQHLRSRDSDMAVVAGASLCLSIEAVLSMASMGFLSGDGKSYSFDHRANGYSRGEGFSVVMLKRMSDAIRDGNTIRAVVRSSGSNQDGHTPGITQPSRDSQARLIRDTYAKAGLDLRATRFFEAHGTGTALGDPTEAEAIGRTFRMVRSPSDPLYIGALKSNIGHLEGGSGLAGIIKAIMVLEKAVIPPNANFERVNPSIDHEFYNLKFPTSCIPWPSDGLRRVSVASFGFGGSNAHVVLEDAYNFLTARKLQAHHQTRISPPDTHQSRILASPFGNGEHRALVKNGEHLDRHLCKSSHGIEGVACVNEVTSVDESVHNPSSNGTYHTQASAHRDQNHVLASSALAKPTQITAKESNSLDHQARLLVFSAADEAALDRWVNVLQAHFAKQHPNARSTENFLDRLAHTLATRKSVFNWRSYALVKQYEDLSRLSELSSRPGRSEKSFGLAFVFTGQGAQYAGMGAALIGNPTFRGILDSFDETLATMDAEFSVVEMLLHYQRFADANVNDPAYSQPMTTALQIALFELLQTLGIDPSVVIGHSSGEIAAAYAAGALSLSSACKISYFRGKLASSLIKSQAVSGAMISVNQSRDQMQARIENNAIYDGKIYVACINSGKNVTVSGREAEIDKLRVELETADIFARKLNTGVAYHCPHMEPIALEYASLLTDLAHGKTRKRRPTFISSVTGAIVQDLSELCTPRYWVRNLTSPVDFAGAMATLLESSGGDRTRILGSAKSQVVQDIIELGPHPALQRPIKDSLSLGISKTTINYYSTLDRNKSPQQTVLNMAGHLFTRGHSLNVDAVNGMLYRQAYEHQRLLNLPSYPFNHSKSYWYEGAISQHGRLRRAPKKELLGTPDPAWNPYEAHWRKYFDAVETPWILDHQVNGKAIYPATGMVVMAIEAATQMADQTRLIEGYHLPEASFSAPVIIDPNEKTEVHLHLCQEQEQSNKDSVVYSFHVYTRGGEGDWITNCRGTLALKYTPIRNGFLSIDKERENLHHRTEHESLKRICTEEVAAEKMYAMLVKNGLRYGSSFQSMDQIMWDKSDVAIGSLRCFEWTDKQSCNPRQPHVVHPVTLDAAGHLFLALLTNGAQDVVFDGIAITRIKDAWIANTGLAYPDASTLLASCRRKSTTFRSSRFSLLVTDPAGNLGIKMSEIEVTNVGGRNPNPLGGLSRQMCFDMRWQPDPDLLSAESLKLFTPEADLDLVKPGSCTQDFEQVLHYFTALASQKIDGRNFEDKSSHVWTHVTWLYERMAQSKSHPRPSNGHILPPDHVEREDLSTLIRKVELGSPEGRLSVQICRNIINTLAGIDTSQQATSYDGLLKRYYHEAFEESAACAQLRTFVKALGHKCPGLKMLSVGAGSEPIRDFVLDILFPDGNLDLDESIAHYNYTEQLDPSNRREANDLAELKGRVGFQALDIDRDPIEQGFQPEAYDLIVAAWMLHSTQDLPASLQHLRKLLKPGGRLVCIECTNPDSLGYEFAFKSSRFWWPAEAKHQSPCLTSEQWSTLLAHTGFGSENMLLSHEHSNTSSAVSVIVAATPVSADKPLAPIQTRERVTIVFEPASMAQAKLKAELENVLANSYGVDCSSMTISEAAVDSAAPLSFLICLLELDQPYLRHLRADTFQAVQRTLTTCKSILWVSGDVVSSSPGSPDSAMITGLARALRTERSSLHMVTLILETLNLRVHEWARQICQVYHTTQTASDAPREVEYREQHGVLLINRIHKSSHLNQEVHRRNHAISSESRWADADPLTLTVPNPGMLDTMRFEADPLAAEPLGPEEVEIQVQAVGINFRDLLVALGKLSVTMVGCECAGVITRTGTLVTTLQPGQRVCAAIIGCTRTLVRCNQALPVAIPPQMTFAEAASLPVTGATAYHALVHTADLQRAETVLIHSAAGGTGQMAVQIAQHLGAEVFVTVGTEEKKQLMMDMYGIPEDHIFPSRDTSFARGISRMTGGRGVDVILNSLSGPALVASWEIIAPYGRFIELGKADIEGNSKLPMERFANNVSFTTIALDHMTLHRPKLVGRALSAVLDLISAGSMKLAHPLQLYPIGQLENAFRVMQGGKNVGKMVLTMNDDDVVKTYLAHKPTYQLDSTATYLIAGGLGGLGRSAARFMVRRGARHLILLSRSGPKSQAAQELLMELSASGVRVATPKCDVSSRQSLQDALSQCAQMPPIKGCLQGTMVLQDTLFDNMTWEQWNTSITSKVDSTWNLHELLPSDLSFFIMLSSVSGIAGSLGQANYAAGNTYQDALAHYRLSVGRRAAAIDLGWMAEVGVVAETAELDRSVQAAGGDLALISEAEFLAILDYYCDPNADLRTPQPIVGLVTASQFRSRGLSPPDWLFDRPLFKFLACDGAQGEAEMPASTGEASVSDRSLTEKFVRAASSADRAAVVADALVSKVTRSLSMLPTELDRQRPLHAYGVDSLLAVEIRNWIAKLFQVDVPIFDIMGQASLEKLAEDVARSGEKMSDR